MVIDVDSLRQDLRDYFGTAAMGNPMAYVDLLKIESANYDEVINIAIKNGFDLSDYQTKERSR